VRAKYELSHEGIISKCRHRYATMPQTDLGEMGRFVAAPCVALLTGWLVGRL
jgi:hypothetical protein